VLFNDTKRQNGGPSQFGNVTTWSNANKINNYLYKIFKNSLALALEQMVNTQLLLLGLCITLHY
jgi:hypothetical protein